MAAYAIFVRERVRVPEGLEPYNQKAGPSLDGHPAKVLAAYGGHEVLEGADLQGCVILEFPTMVAAKAWYDSPAYREARELRFKVADYRAFLVQGL